MTLSFRFTIALGLIAAGLVAGAAAYQKSQVNVSRGDLALQGYDAVAYWTSGQPTLGSPSFEHRWNNAVWRFSTAETASSLQRTRPATRLSSAGTALTR